MVDIDPLVKKLTVSTMACPMGGIYAPTGASWEFARTTPPVTKKARVPVSHAPKSDSPLTGFLLGDRFRCIYYVDDQLHIHEIASQDWAMTAVDKDLTKDVTSIKYWWIPGSPLTCHHDGNNITRARSVFFIGAPNAHVYRIYWDGNNRGYDDITALANASSAPAAQGSGLACFGPNSDAHVFYCSADGHVHQIYWNGSRWGHDDLTSLTGASPAVRPTPVDSKAPVSALACVVGINNAFYVFYISADGHIHWISFNDGKWGHDDIVTTAMPGSRLSCISNPNNLPSQVFEAQVFYVNTLNHINQLSWDGSKWEDVDLMNDLIKGFAQPPLVSSQSGLVGLILKTGSLAQLSNNIRGLYYIGKDKHVEELWRLGPLGITGLKLNDGNEWHYNSLTGAPPGWKEEPIAAYTWNFAKGYSAMAVSNNVSVGGKVLIEDRCLSIEDGNKTDTVVIDPNSPTFSNGTVTFFLEPKNTMGGTMLVFRYNSPNSWGGYFCLLGRRGL